LGSLSESLLLIGENILKKIVLILLISFVVLLSCDKRETLYLFNWTYYTPSEVIKLFEQEYNVKVKYDEFASNEEMFAKLRANRRSSYDIVVPSADYVEIMIQNNMLQELDHSMLPNLRYIYPNLIEILIDPEMRFAVPYYYGVTGIAVNTQRVPEFERSWNIFAREDLRRRMTLLDDVRETMGAALIYLGYSINTYCPNEIAEARDLINNVWKPNILRFDAEANAKIFAQGDIDVVHVYPDALFDELAGTPRLEHTVFFIPREGGVSWVDSMVILSTARNPTLAHKFINFIHRPDIYVMFLEAFRFPSTTNSGATELMTHTPNYPAEYVENTELGRDVGEYLRYYNDAWFGSIRTGR